MYQAAHEADKGIIAFSPLAQVSLQTAGSLRMEDFLRRLS